MDIKVTDKPEWALTGYNDEYPTLLFSVIEVGDVVSIEFYITLDYKEYKLGWKIGDKLKSIVGIESYEHALLIADYEIRKLNGESNMLDCQPKDCLLYPGQPGHAIEDID